MLYHTVESLRPDWIIYQDFEKFVKAGGGTREKTCVWQAMSLVCNIVKQTDKQTKTKKKTKVYTCLKSDDVKCILRKG